MNQIIDVAIVGAGVSGLYSAWRLKVDAAQQGRTLDVRVFEGSARVGGRLLSVKPPFVNDTYVELGGMRFTESQPLICDLVRALGLASGELPDANPDNLAYLRGERLQMSDLTDADRIPYVIDESLRNRESLSNLIAVAAVRSLGPAFKELLDIDLTLETLKSVTTEHWRTVGERGSFEGKPLYETPLRYILERTLGHGAVQLLQDSLGYDSILWTWSAADGFPFNLTDMGSAVRHLHLADGFSAFPRRLQEKALEVGAGVQLNTRVRSVEDRLLPDGTTGIAFTTVDLEGTETLHLARKLILAMPRRSIELLDRKGPLFDSRSLGFKPLLESVSPVPLFKIALCYENCWWEKVVGGGSNGKSVTDLPMRQVYYWKVNPDDQQGVVLIYDGGLTKSYWEQLDNPEAPKPQVKLAGRKEGVELWADYAAPARIIFEAHRQLLELHGLPESEVPAPYAAACMSWSRDPYGGGAHFWNVGARSYEVAEKILHPIEHCPIYLCGEAWSHEQGWVEGALATSEALLTRHFGLPPLHDTHLV
jgi:monoamine oxidase